jgi:hypothetical protein
MATYHDVPRLLADYLVLCHSLGPDHTRFAEEALDSLLDTSAEAEIREGLLRIAHSSSTTEFNRMTNAADCIGRAMSYRKAVSRNSSLPTHDLCALRRVFDPGSNEHRANMLVTALDVMFPATPRNPGVAAFEVEALCLAGRADEAAATAARYPTLHISVPSTTWRKRLLGALLREPQYDQVPASAFIEQYRARPQRSPQPEHEEDSRRILSLYLGSTAD